jgi:rhodanese-related sulfurtransferase
MINYIIIALAVLLLIYIIGKKVLIMLNPNIKNVTAEEANKLIKENKDLVILDVRTKDEYKSGHIPGAVSIPVDQLPSRISELEKYIDKPVLVYCASGGRSPRAVSTLLHSKFTNIYHLSRGISTWSYKLAK